MLQRSLSLAQSIEREKVHGSPPLLSIQALRAVAALGVMTLHVENEVVVHVLGGPATSNRFIIGAAGVDLFFVISGFVLVYASENLFGRREAPILFFLRRLARIAPLYWALTAALILYILVVHGSRLMEIYSPASLVASFLFYPYPRVDGLAFPVHLLGWTLNYEMFFYAVFALAILLPRREAVIAVSVFFFAMVAAGTMFELPLPLAFWANSIILEFCFGMAIALGYRDGLRLSPAAAWALGLAACVAFAVMTYLGGGWRVLFWGLPSAALVAALALSSHTWHPGPIGRFFGVLGDASYSLYLVHGLVYATVHWTLGRWIDFSPFPWLYALLAFLLAIAGGLCCYLLFERPVTRMLQQRIAREATR
jgi:exopolysaccharide production protein ExoZ